MQTAAPVPQTGSEPVRQRYRLRFRKEGNLRLLSHHDLMRCLERMLRRAALPFRSTQGFNPKPRLTFPLSLALGIVGYEEVLELELDQPVPPAEVRARLAQQAPAGLELLDIRPIAAKTTAQVRRVCYRLPVPPERTAGLAERVAAVLAAPECWVERSRPQPRRVNLRPYLNNLCILPDAVEMDLGVTPTGTARPDEVLGLLGLADLLAAGAVLERTKVELHDEVEVSEEHEPPEGSAGEAGIPRGGPRPPARR